MVCPLTGTVVSTQEVCHRSHGLMFLTFLGTLKAKIHVNSNEHWRGGILQLFSHPNRGHISAPDFFKPHRAAVLVLIHVILVCNKSSCGTTFKSAQKSESGVV